ncbi:MAG: MraY family glycosyltransferase [Myxococcota bacterium]
MFQLPQVYYHDILRLTLAFLLSAIISLWIIPILARAAKKHSIVDKPSTPLKNQKEPVPYFGGLGVFIAFLASVSITFDFSKSVLGVIFGSTLILLLGLIDDLGVLAPLVKLSGQILVAIVLIKSGIHIDIVFLPKWLDYLLTLFWVVGIVNAFNIIDIMDGLAGSVALVAAIANGFFAFWNGETMIALLSLALGGGVLGFLKYNWRPASIYLGDTGSMFIGFILAALAMNNTYTAVNDLALLSPVLILGVPIFDTTLVTILRIRNGRSPMFGSPDHFAIRLAKIGFSPKKVALLAALVTLLLSVVAVIISFIPFKATLILLAAVLITAFISAYFLARIPIEYPKNL